MKILFWGGGKGNSGPENVSNSYRTALTDSFVLVNSTHKYGEFIEGVWKLLFCDCLVVSGVSRKGTLLVGFARVFGKKTAYIMHGCAEYEHEINQTKTTRQGLAQEQYLLKHTTLLLPVSKKYMLWVQERYPEYAYKTKYLYNGIDRNSVPMNTGMEKTPRSVIAAGGNKKQKNNNVLAEIVESMQGAARLEIYDGLHQPFPNKKYRYAKYMGGVPHDQYIQRLQQSQLFVVNSILESFSVSAIEALMCGCSVLISEAAGVTDLLALEETDIIHDPTDKDEIRGKIEYLLEYPNNERILSQLDVEEYSYPNQVKKLEKMCRELLES